MGLGGWASAAEGGGGGGGNGARRDGEGLIAGGALNLGADTGVVGR